MTMSAGEVFIGHWAGPGPIPDEVLREMLDRYAERRRAEGKPPIKLPYIAAPRSEFPIKDAPALYRPVEGGEEEA